MTLVSRRLESGLVLQEHSQDEAQLQRALKQIDEDLVLWPPDGECSYYRVMCRVSDWQPAIPVVAWMDGQGNALPLSSGLIDEVQKWRPENRGKRGLDADAHNALHKETVRRLQDERGQEIIDDHRAKVDRGRVSVAMGAKTAKPSWQRNNHFPARIRELTK